jgi:23S rRNA (cytidine1920-2'-O)/16S rRNA (cytidine1409-2'-O)-methyltransferase
VGSGGVVRDVSIHKKVLRDVVAGVEAAGFRAAGHMESPIKGAAAGNTEFLALFHRLQPE